MLTGDNRTTAQAVARKLGIAEVEAEVLPDQKSAVVAKLQKAGRIVAMAGERMRVPGHTEMSAVCCHPDFRGRGWPTDLMRAVSREIVARGETPFLHVLDSNAGAVRLYGSLGFRHRRTLTIMTVRPPARLAAAQG